MRRKKIINKQKITRKTAVYLISELCQSLGNKFSAQFCMTRQIFELRKPTTMYKDHFGQVIQIQIVTRNVSVS